MSSIAALFGILVGVMNVTMNYLVKVAANDTKATSWLDALLSAKFLLAFIVGSLSITMMFLFYYTSKSNLAQGIILMGATSIVAGAVFSMTVLGDKITKFDMAILIFIALFYSIKYIKAA